MRHFSYLVTALRLQILSEDPSQCWKPSKGVRSFRWSGFLPANQRSQIELLVHPFHINCQLRPQNTIPFCFKEAPLQLVLCQSMAELGHRFMSFRSNCKHKTNFLSTKNRTYSLILKIYFLITYLKFFPKALFDFICGLC